MQAKAHFYLIVGYSLLQLLVLSVLDELSASLDHCQDLQERDHTHISQLVHRISILESNVISISRHIMLIELPNKQEGISDVLIWRATELIHYAMHDLSDLIHKGHYALLQDLSCISEISDIAETKDGHDLLPREDWIHTATATDVLGDNLRACFTKTKS